ncbi:Protein takeout [Frankliniella fusca]|uniref:Protein takeout n=2 Tax=Arthropoda TaxID=6656 RepID=A0AAE1LAJ5_9NEOP|nr:Protein takeout [Frankliniella fusca]
MLSKVVLLAVWVAAAAAQLPEFIPVCARNDPALEDCIVKAVDDLRPRLMQGIPELDVPAIDGFKIDEVVVGPGSSYRIVGRNIVVKGLEDFRVFRLKADLDRNTFYVGVEIPAVRYTGQYTMNIPTPVMRVNGAGNVRGNATNIRANAVLEAKVVKREGKSYYNFKTIDLDVKIGDYKVRLDGLFRDNKILEDLVLNMINERSKEFAWMAEPMAERAAAQKVLMWANTIAKNLPIEDMFP